ncbi:MAG: ABC transporter ATP-binding protein/permease [Mycoplasma sp.]
MIDKQLFKLIGKNKKYIFITILIMIVGLFCNIGLTIGICWTLGNAINVKEFEAYIYPMIIIPMAILLKFITIKLINKTKNILGDAIKKDLRCEIFTKITDLGWQNNNALLTRSSLTQLSIEGIEQLDLYYSVYLPQFFYSLIAPLILFIITVFINWQVSLVLLVCVPLIPMSIVMISKYAKKVFAKYWGRYISMGDTFLDNINGLKDLKILNADGIQQNRMSKESEEFRKITMKVLIMQLASVTIMDLVAYGGAAIGIALTIININNDSLGVVKGVFLILIAIEFFLPLRVLGSAFHIAMNGASAGNKIVEILNIQNPIWGDEKVQSNDLSLKNINFKYEDKLVLKNININFNQKGVTAIVGESGSGKSTIVNILSGLIAQSSGELLIGGIMKEKISKESFYENFSLVTYDSFVFNETIENNFKMSNKNITEDQIWKYLEDVNLHNFIRRNGGLNFIVQEDSNNLSGGQKQRLSLAISLSSNKSIYIFDEATSNIDFESEKIIMDNIYNISKKSNVILVSHRLVNVVNADNIIFLENGEIIETGKHEKLIQNKGKYYNLFKQQDELEKTISIESLWYCYE